MYCSGLLQSKINNLYNFQKLVIQDVFLLMYLWVVQNIRPSVSGHVLNLVYGTFLSGTGGV